LAHEYETATSAQRLRRWNRAVNPFVIVAAILPLGPLATGEEPTDGPGLVVALASWAVFAVDFAVRTRLDDTFLATWKGRLYLAIVVVTFPVYVLVPGLEEADLLVMSRLGWVAVLAISAFEGVGNIRVLVRRLGVAGLYASTAVVLAAFVVKGVEEPEDGFATVGDSFWWAISTITTVGYGDRVPVTATGRVMGAVLMLVGLAFLGVLAASLANYFGFDEAETGEPDVPSEEQRHERLVAEVRELRAEVARALARLDSTGEDP
jgi:voltage-gated potassium channel